MNEFWIENAKSPDGENDCIEISHKNHESCVIVYGDGLVETVRRAVTILEALNASALGRTQ